MLPKISAVFVVFVLAACSVLPKVDPKVIHVHHYHRSGSAIKDPRPATTPDPTPAPVVIIPEAPIPVIVVPSPTPAPTPVKPSQQKPSAPIYREPLVKEFPDNKK
jgi:hypothetical protein